jgi:hypothetical protein
MNAGRLAAAVVLLGGGAVTATACGDLVAGDRANVTALLCGQLGDCYGAEVYPCGAMEDALREASPGVRDEFLTAFDEDECLGSCPRSLACLDREPYCSPGGACDTETDCCGWSFGVSACGGDGGAACCAPRGVACGGEGDLACCDATCERGYCGGYACRTVGQACERGEDCCTRRCEDGACAAKICSDLGDPCASDGDCCNPPSGVLTADAAPAVAVCDPSGVCTLETTQPCVDPGAPCDPGGSGVGCCGADMGIVCVEAIDGTGVCGVAGCFASGLDCAFDGQCCGDLICEYSFGEPVCATRPGACGKAGDACGDDGACCPGRTCVEGTCSEVEPPTCGITSCHSPCEEGGPIAAGDCAGEPFAACVDAIAASDSFCSCTAWDFVCADTARSSCSNVCP